MVTDPLSEMIQILYDGLKKHGGGTLTILDADTEDEELKEAINYSLLHAHDDNIVIDILWSVTTQSKIGQKEELA